jgi:hypothetical protein
MRFFIMTAEQADSVRTDALQPIERQGGLFIVGESVMTDETHAAQWDTLATFPTMEIDDPAFPPEIEYPEI